MFPDGICRVSANYYTKTVQFQDINYQLSLNEDKTAIFEGWCDFLNYFDASVRLELSFVNMSANKDTYGQQISIPLRGDADDSIREEYTQMLRSQLAKGNNSACILTFLCAYAIIKRNKGVVGADVPPRGRANILRRTLLWFCMK